MDRDTPPVLNLSGCTTSSNVVEPIAPNLGETSHSKTIVITVNNAFEEFPCKNILSNDCIEESLSEDIQNIDHPFETMGIENNTWNDETDFASTPASDFPIPLPPPGSYDEIQCLDSGMQSSDHGPFHESELGQLFSSSAGMPEDVNDATATAGVCGLHNMGNTCFMGAGLQCLAATPALVEYFLARPSSEKDLPHSLTEQFSSLIQKMWSGKFSVLSSDEFKQALGINHPQFKDYRQHDCQEFVALLLDNLHEQLNQASCKSILSDMSTAPPTPYSSTDAFDDRDLMRKAPIDSSAHVSPAQTVTSFDRCNQSSSSHSSESSGESRSVFRLQPIPEHILPFDILKNDADLSMDVVEQPTSASITPELADVDNSAMDLFCNQISKDNSSCNNLVTENQLKRASNEPGDAVLDKNEIATRFNNVSQRFQGLEHILKDAKTSNVNVLVSEQEINNEIRFDSEKFPKQEKVRRRESLENPNLTEFHNFDGKTVSTKRIKDNNLFNDSAVESGNEFDEESLDLESSKCFNNIKRMRLGDNEKNFRMEIERKFESDEEQELEVGTATAGSSSSGHQIPSHHQNDEVEADKFWEKHLGANQSIVVDTFQGQFKSTVVCSSCGYISVTHEPFMYLSVPVPHAMERQICVTVVPVDSRDSVKYLLTLNKQDKVMELKEELLRLIGPEGPKSLVLAEVLDAHIARTLDENLLLRYVNDVNRSIYAFEMLPSPASKGDFTDTGMDVIEQIANPVPLDLSPDLEDVRIGMPSCSGEGATSPSLPENLEVCLPGSGDGDGSNLMGPLTEIEFDELTAPNQIFENRDSWKTCTICLEDIETNVRCHETCGCFLCNSCIDISCKHYNPEGDMLTCPVCGAVVKPETEFVPVDKVGDVKPTSRILNVPIVFRLDTEGDGNNNMKTMQLFGHPHIIRLPSSITGEDLYTAVDRLVPYSAPFEILLVDGQGYRCSRCMFTEHCRGCLVSHQGELRLHKGDTLAVRLYEEVADTVRTVDHQSMAGLRSNEPLSLYDCLQAFSKSEQLDENNPWYCPVCSKNQCATKTLSVWRYPNFLIVYLKRFIFHDGVSVKLDNKITFPLTGLKFNSSSGQHYGPTHTYNLYSSVCHFGDSTAGHYTAYTKHLSTGEWHYFNDADVSKQKPLEEHYNNGYVLFYQKQGVTYDLPKQTMTNHCSKAQYELNVPKLLLPRDGPKPNIDQLILDLDSSVEQDRQQEIMEHSSARALGS